MNAKVKLHIKQIENNPEVMAVSKVLAELEKNGLQEASVASGWIRGFLTNSVSSDIDISYWGDVHFLEAQKILKKIITRFKLEKLNWDIEGIWNAKMAYPEMHSVVESYLIYYVDSIDSVYLGAGGKLHDPTGFGFADSLSKTLRMNDFKSNGYRYGNSGIVYLCLEGCRRITKFRWKPTDRSVELIKSGVDLWKNLSESDKEYFYKRIMKKYTIEEGKLAKPIYDKYGWGFIFE